MVPVRDLAEIGHGPLPAIPRQRAGDRGLLCAVGAGADPDLRPDADRQFRPWRVLHAGRRAGVVRHHAPGADFFTGLVLVAASMAAFGWLVDRLLIERVRGQGEAPGILLTKIGRAHV